MTTLSHKEMTAHIRAKLKSAGIKARCRMFVACGTRYIQVFGPKHGHIYSVDEIRTIATIAMANNLTQAQRSRIEPDFEALLHLKNEWNFEFHGMTSADYSALPRDPKALEHIRIDDATRKEAERLWKQKQFARMTNKDIFEAVGVSVWTLQNWFGKRSEYITTIRARRPKRK